MTNLEKIKNMDLDEKYKLLNKEKLIEFVKNNSGYYDTTDVADFIIDNKEELLKIIKNL